MSRDITPPLPQTGSLSGDRSITPPLLRSNPLLKLLNPPPQVPDSSAVQLKWATVTAAYPDPVQVQIDTEDAALAGAPAMLTQVNLGDRVLLAIAGRRVIVLGVAQPDQSQQPPTIQTGSITITPSAANTPTTATVTFDIPFSQAPHAVVSAFTTAPGTVVTGVSVAAVSATSIDVVLTRTDTTPTNVQWIAMTN